MESFEIVHLQPGTTHIFERIGKKEKVIVACGRCRIRFSDRVIAAAEGTNVDLTVSHGRFEIDEVSDETTVVRMCGRWGEETGGSGLFTGTTSDSPKDHGDPVDYVKATHFDCHYHDCDEYWIILEGRGTAVSEGTFYEVGPGDCVATGMGHHHDIPQVVEPVKAIYFETTLEGEKRRGHLWNHTHGPAQPKLDRV